MMYQHIPVMVLGNCTVQVHLRSERAASPSFSHLRGATNSTGGAAPYGEYFPE
eukprot:COSAG02_NODE_553_length_20425_cov_17.986372_3_plen_53_part_00